MELRTASTDSQEELNQLLDSRSLIQYEIETLNNYVPALAALMA